MENTHLAGSLKSMHELHKVRAVQVEHIRFDPVLKALVFQLLESTSLSRHWFQIDSTCIPYNQAGLSDEQIAFFYRYGFVVIRGRAVQARPRIESAWFQRFNLMKRNFINQLEPGF